VEIFEKNFFQESIGKEKVWTRLGIEQVGIVLIVIILAIGGAGAYFL